MTFLMDHAASCHPDGSHAVLFRTFREKCGHRIVAKIASLSFCCRGIDTAARFGGNELLLSYRKQTRKRPKEWDDVSASASPMTANGPKPSISVGAAIYPHNGETIESILSSSDSAMYCMKQQRVLPGWRCRTRRHRTTSQRTVRSKLPYRRSEPTSQTARQRQCSGWNCFHTSPHNVQMRRPKLTSKQLFSVDCPACGAAAGDRCRLHSGFQHSEPHLDRKLSAIEILENKKILDTNRRVARKYLITKLG
jgi:Diguanylate cyclase, GGDEF domain